MTEKIIVIRLTIFMIWLMLKADDGDWRMYNSSKSGESYSDWVKKWHKKIKKKI